MNIMNILIFASILYAVFIIYFLYFSLIFYFHLRKKTGTLIIYELAVL